MSVNKFGHYSGGAKALRGPKGDGFSLTDDGDYDMQNKLLRNVADPLNDKDAVNFEFLKNNTIPKGEGFSLTDDGNYDMQNKLLRNVANPLKDKDAVNLKFLNSNTIVKTDKGFDAGGVKIINIARPEADYDVVNRRYLAIHTPHPNINYWDFKDRRLVRVKEPRDLTDGVNKKYMVDYLNKQIDTTGIVKTAELDSRLSPITNDISGLKSKQSVDVIARDEFTRILKSFGVHLFRHIHRYVPQGRTAQPPTYNENNYLNWNEILEVGSLTKDGGQGEQ